MAKLGHHHQRPRYLVATRFSVIKSGLSFILSKYLYWFSTVLLPSRHVNGFTHAAIIHNTVCGPLHRGF